MEERRGESVSNGNSGRRGYAERHTETMDVTSSITPRGGKITAKINLKRSLQVRAMVVCGLEVRSDEERRNEQKGVKKKKKKKKRRMCAFLRVGSNCNGNGAVMQCSLTPPNMQAN